MNKFIFYFLTCLKRANLTKKAMHSAKFLSLRGICAILMLFVPMIVQAQTPWFYDDMGTNANNTNALPLPYINSTPACNPAGVVNLGLQVTGLPNGTANGTPINHGGWDGVSYLASASGASVCWTGQTGYPSNVVSSNGTTSVNFTYTLNVTGTATITSLAFGMRRNNGLGLNSLAAVSINGTSYRGNTVLTSSVGTVTEFANSAWHSALCTPPTTLTFTNQTVTILITFDTPVTPGNTAGMLNRFDEFKIFGTVTPPVSCTTPIAYNLTGGGAYCSGGAGVVVGVANSETGVNYQLKIGGVNTGGTVAGNTGNAISFPSQTAAGNYTVGATTATGGCTNAMTGSVNISISPNVGTPNFTAPTTTLCTGSTSTYTATASNSTIIAYSILAGGANINPSTGAVSSVTGNFTVVATASGSCGPNTTANQAVTVTPFDLAMTAGSDTTKANGTLVSCNGPYTIYYRRLNGNPTWSSITTASASFTLTNLTPASNYIAYAQNANSVTTGNVYFTTTGWLPCGNAITSVTATVTCNQLAVNWNPAPSGTTYTVTYREVSPSLGNAVGSTSTTNSKTFTLSPSLYGKTLEVLVFYACNSQYTPSSAPVYVSIPNPVPQQTPTLSVSAVNCNGFTASWGSISNATNYRVQVRNVATNTVTKNIIVSAPTTTTVITGLASNYNYSVTVTPLGCNNLVGTTSASISVQTCVGVIPGPNHRTAKAAFSVYPNPGEGMFTVTASDINPETTFAEISVLDIVGKTIYNRSLVIDSGNIAEEIDIRSLPAGTYFVRILSDKEVFTQKVIKY